SGDRLDRVHAGSRIILLDHLPDLHRRTVRGGLAALRLRQEDLLALGSAEFLDARFAEVKTVDVAAQLFDVDRLLEGRADHLPADEVDPNIEAADVDDADAV